MSRHERREGLSRFDVIEEAVFDAADKLGSVHDLEEIVWRTYDILSENYMNKPDFWSGRQMEEQFIMDDEYVGMTPRTEIMYAIEDLVEWGAMDLFGDDQLMLNRKYKIE